MDEPWTLSGLVEEVARRIEALPAPRNGQVRAVPDERTIRYYGTLGLLDRPSAMRGRTALYGRRHVAQVVAIKRLQTMGRSLSEIQDLWPTLDDSTLARMSGVELRPSGKAPARAAFWKREPVQSGGDHPAPAIARDEGAAVDARSEVAGGGDPDGIAGGAGVLPRGIDAPATGPPGALRGRRAAAPVTVELRVELATGVVLSLSTDESAAVDLAPADVRALRAAAAPLLAELASRGLASHPGGQES